MSIPDNLKKRLLTVFVGAPIVIGLLYIGGITFKIMMAVAMFLAFYEWFSMSKKSRHSVILALFGAIYIIVGFISIYMLRQFDEGFVFVLLLLLSVWGSDSVAYIVGKTFKGPKMSPTISPNKTWSGYIGALLGASIPFIIYNSGDDILLFLMLSVIIGIVGQSGDLMVSALKRHVKVKDTGALFPGHGGMLDRIDALLLVAPVLLFALPVIFEKVGS